MVDMSGASKGLPLPPNTRQAFEIGREGQVIAVSNVILAIPLGLAIDFGLWWLGLPSGLAVLLVLSVFARRHIFTARQGGA